MRGTPRWFEITQHPPGSGGRETRWEKVGMSSKRRRHHHTLAMGLLASLIGAVILLAIVNLFTRGRAR